MDDEIVVHRPLASAARRQVLAALRDASAPRSVGQLADTVGLHPNTVRGHLDVLGAAGLVASVRRDPHGPGRPGLAYRATLADAVAAARARLTAISAGGTGCCGHHTGTQLLDLLDMLALLRPGLAGAAHRGLLRGALDVLDDPGSLDVVADDMRPGPCTAVAGGAR